MATSSEKLIKLVGGIFFAVGILLVVVGIFVLAISGSLFGGGIPLLIGVVYTILGGGMLLSNFKKSMNRKKIMGNGVHYFGKIYGYVEDKSHTMNNDYTVHIKVRYFDEMNVEREAVIPTGFTKGSGDYPIGATIEIVSLGASYTWVPGSVSFGTLPREDELMDDKPIDPSLVTMIGVSCPSCGASFSASRGYMSKCPYCGNSINC